MDSFSGLGMKQTVDATKRDAYLDTKIGGKSWMSTTVTAPNSQFAGTETHNRLFNKTVTNFAQVRYNDNGGLNPVSPVKRGLVKDN